MWDNIDMALKLRLTYDVTLPSGVYADRVHQITHDYADKNTAFTYIVGQPLPLDHPASPTRGQNRVYVDGVLVGSRLFSDV